MDITITRSHQRDFSIEYGEVPEEYNVDLPELWDRYIDKKGVEHIYKPFKDMSDNTQETLRTKINDWGDLEGETFYGVDDWEYHFGNTYNVTDDYITTDTEPEDGELFEILDDVVPDLIEDKIFDIYLNPLKHAVQSEVNELKTKRELRKVKAEKLISNIRLSLENSLKQYDKEIESKLMTSLNA